MAVWRRKPQSEVMVHSDQNSQFSSYDWQDCRGNCHDNAVAESFFQRLKRERIKRKTYTTREEARQDVLITSKCFTTSNADTATQMTCLL